MATTPTLPASSSIDSFMALDPDSQKAALAAMDDGTKQSLLSGIQARSGGSGTTSAPAIPPPPGTESTSSGITVPAGTIATEEPKLFPAIGAGLRRLKDTATGLYQTFVPQDKQPGQSTPDFLLNTIPAYKIAKGMVNTDTQLAQQTAANAKGAITSAAAGDYPTAALQGGKAITSALAINNPLASGPVANVNQLESEDKSSEAMGQGVADVLMLGLGLKTGRAATPETTVNKLSFVTKAAPADLKAALPELQQTFQNMGGAAKISTYNDIKTLIDNTNARINRKFEFALGTFQGANGQVIPNNISTDLILRAREMPPSADGKAIAGLLRNRALEYQKPWSMQELNQERTMRNGFLDGTYDRPGSVQMNKLQSSAETIADKIIADGSRDILYDTMEQRFPGQGFRQMKLVQSSLMDVQDAFNKNIEKIERDTAVAKGTPAFTKGKGIGATSSIGEGGSPHARLYNLIPGRSPINAANAASRTAFAPLPAAEALRFSILNTPLTNAAQQARPPLLPPPPDR